MSFVWEDALTDEDRLVVEEGCYGQKRGCGKILAFVIIDPQYNYVGANRPIEDELEEWPSGGGEAAWRAIEIIQKLKDQAQAANIPIIYTRNVQKKSTSFDSFAVKA